MSLLIFQKNINVPKHKRSGEYRKQTIYKKRFGSSVKSKTDKTQKVDIVMRNIAYNIGRIIRIGKDIVLIIVRIMRVSY